jgi:putative nucleotidyltransferase with HDIG domain
LSKSNVFNITPKDTTMLIWYISQRLSELEKDHSEITGLKFNKNEIANLTKIVLKTLSYKDNNTFHHSLRTAKYSTLLGNEIKLSNLELIELELAAIFHDIGKIATPDNILNKPARLTEDEFHIMKQHPVKSYELLNEIEGFSNIAKGARGHHERFDGNGYPDALKGEEIPLYSRIILISDTFDSMTEDRVYRKGLSKKIAFEELQEFSGTQFDGNLVKSFINAINNHTNENINLPFLKDKLNKVA